MASIIDKAKEQEDYKKFEIVAEILNLNAIQKMTGTKFYVGETYLDFGQNWKWTTILADGKRSSWQVLNPRQWDEIYLADDIIELANIAKDIINGTWFKA